MLKYTIKRIITFIPMLIAISLISFIISINAPGDPVERMTKADAQGGADANAGSNAEEKEKIRQKLGLHLPVFYFSFSNYATPKNLHEISNKRERNNIENLIDEYGNWTKINQYYQTIKLAKDNHNNISAKTILEKDSTLEKNKINEEWNQITVSLTTMLEESNHEIIKQNENTLDLIINNTHSFLHLRDNLKKISSSKKELIANPEKWKLYIPTLKYYGINNQYHVWLFGNNRDRHGLIRGDFGESFQDGKDIGTKIWERIGISFTLSILSIIIAYLVSLPIGIYSAYKKDSIQDRGMSLILFILYSLPSFFIGTLLLLWFANTDNLYWFPEAGIQNAVTANPNWSWWEWEAIKHRIPYLILPLITYTYGSFAFLSRIMRIGMIDVMSQDYIRTARSKGLSEKTVILKHALRNSLLPIITVFAAIFPMAVGGSIIIEVIFTIPGMGKEIFEAVISQDYPMIISFFTLTGLLTMIGYLVSDILYALVDPRISFK